MSETESHLRTQNVFDLHGALPQELSFRIAQINDCVYELLSEKCVIQLSFELLSDSSACVDIFSASDHNRIAGMAFWVLRQLRGVRGPHSSTNHPFATTGKLLVEFFPDLLTGDFSIQCEYERIKNRIGSQVLNVTALPLDHPTRIRYENCDLLWLTEMEDGTFRKLYKSH